MKVWSVTKWLTAVQHEWLRIAIFLLLGGNLMAILTLIQFSPILSFHRGASLWRGHSWFLLHKSGKTADCTVREKTKKHATATKQSFPGNGRLLLGLFVFSFFIKQKQRFVLKSCLCTFSKGEMQTISCYWMPESLYCLARQQHMAVSLSAYRGGSAKGQHV